jgi:tRNA-2-methylthio-N6-dimethylallyladenosine synthase
MNRTYTREQYLKMIFDLKKNLPDIKFSSDFIVGFPSENENDFNSTLSLIQEVEYESIFSFVYSPRKYTKALLLKDDLDIKVKKQRLYKLQEVQRDIQLKNNKKLIGKVVEVLVVKRNPKKMDEVIARTESYRVVNFESDAKPGEFKKILIENVGPYSLRGKGV